MSNEKWLTRKEVAAIIRYAPKTLENWAQMKPPKGPKCFKTTSGRYRYLEADVREWQEQQRQLAAA